MTKTIFSTERAPNRGTLARALACAALITLAVGVAPTPSGASSAIEAETTKGRSLDLAKQFITDIAQQSMSLLHAPDRTADERQQAFRELWSEGVAFDTIARFVLGRHWRSATPEQRTRYQVLFVNSVMRTSETVFAGFTDEQLEITGARLAGKKDMLVSTKLVRANGPSVPINWRLRIINGRYQIIDVAIEGVSMILTKRSEYSSVVKSKGLEGLLAALQASI